MTKQIQDRAQPAEHATRHAKSAKTNPPVTHPGFSSLRADGTLHHAGWCSPAEPTQGKDKTHLPSGPVVLFGADDQFVAGFDGGRVAIWRFEAFEAGERPLLRAEIDADVVKAYPAAASVPLMLFALDTKGRVLSIDFRKREECASVEGLTRTPLLETMAEGLNGQIEDMVVLRRKLVLTVAEGRGQRALYEVNRRSGLANRLGDYPLDGDLSALEPERHNILLGRQAGELRLVMTGKEAGSGGIEMHSFEIDRVTAAAIAGGTHMVIARKGGFVEKVDMRAALPVQSARAADPLARLCYVLHQLLERCGCACTCKDVDDTPGDPGGPRDPNDPRDDEPCGDRHSAKLGFTVKSFQKAGRHLVALGAANSRMAVLDQKLDVQFERKIDRDSAKVATGRAHTQKMLVQIPRKSQIEAWRLADYVDGLKPWRPGVLDRFKPRPPKDVTYWGRKMPVADVNPTVRICLFPVVDGGQTYGDADMTELIDQVSAKIFNEVNDYYTECSFEEVDIEFSVFGHDFGGMRQPLVLPNPQASYWWDGFRGGGITALMPADYSDPVVLDGTEAFQMQANPRAGAVKTYDLPFAAMWSSGHLGAFPVTLDFDGTETLELDVVTQTGDAHTLTLSFPNTTLSVDEGGDIAGFLDALADLLTNAIRAAEATLPGAPQLIEDVEMRRIRTSSDTAQFGRAQGRFRIASAGGAATQKGRISVSGPVGVGAPLTTLGLSSADIPGVLSSTGAVESYFDQVLRAAQVDAAEGIGGSAAYFSTAARTEFEAGPQTVRVGIDLTRDFGGQEATIERVSSAGLSGTGWDVAMPNPGSEAGPNNSNALRKSVELADDTFTAAMEHLRTTTAWNRDTVEAMFAGYDVMMIAHVGAPHPAIPLSDQWECDDPAGFGGKRMYARSHFAKDLNPPAGEDPVQMGTWRIIGQRFNAFNGPEMTNQSGVMAHEIGHALSLPDLYSANGYRDDVAYIDPWGMMAGGNREFHHFCGWSKWSLGWIPDDPDPEINRTIFVDLPSASDVLQKDAWLVPIEFWDDAMRDDVRDEVGGSVEIGQLMKLNLGSDGGVTAFLELRAKGTSFSRNLSPEPTVIATNGLDPDSDRHWAVNGLYRRSVHLLNDGTELRAMGDTWDFATAPEFPVKGCVAEVIDTRTVRGTIPVYRVRVTREQAEYIDLHFQDHVPGWKSPDIWVDWPGDNPDPAVPRMYPEGTPTDQGETVRYPSSGTETHYVVARVHNAGNVEAQDVKVRWFVCDPPGAGDDGRWVNRGTQTIPVVPADGSDIAVFDWAVDTTTNVHQCMRMEIIDWTVPSGVDPATGDTVALASDDVKLQNNNAQQNVFDFEALTSSPYPPITFPMQVHNDRPGTEIAALVPSGLPRGAKLTISPQEHFIPSGKSRVFNCTLELDDAVIRPGCDNDSGFLLTAWRRTNEADEIWGSSFYHIRPRYRTSLELIRGSWFHGRVLVTGRLHVLAETPIDLADEQPLIARIRLLPDGPGAQPIWRSVPIDTNGVFSLDMTFDGGKTMQVQAWFDRTDRLGSSVSGDMTLKQSFLE